ncbi:MAG: hypothetical protein FJ387_07055 [Verrucomicrobia bacterium]|nr:hypothetical protein [Verrucomicrobiota bacterium]
MLAYDCGFLLQPPAATLGVGTLVLVQPAAVGDERQSEPIELPLSDAAALEIALFTRRLAGAATGVRYDLLRSHVFVPTRNAAGEARLRVAMRVEEGHERLATVTADIHDLNSHEHIRFERLPLVGASELMAPPLRDARQLRALEWAQKIQQARQGSPSPASVDQWRQALEQRAALLPRAAYAERLLDTVRLVMRALAKLSHKPFAEVATGLTTWLVTETAVQSRAPDEVQSEARRLLFQTMHRAASLIAAGGGHRCRAWLRLYPSGGAVPSEPTCAQRLVNSISQDRATSVDPAGLTAATTRLQSAFRLACSSPSSLNIAW